MSILFITHKYPPSIGGMQRQSFHLIEGVSKVHNVYTIIKSPEESLFGFLLRLKPNVKAMLKAHPDIRLVHCNDGTMASFCTWIGHYANIPVTATIHGLDIVFPNQIFQHIVMAKLRKLDQVYAVSKATAAECLKRGFKKSQVSVIPNGVDHQLSEMPVDFDFCHRFLKDNGIDLNHHRLLVSMGRAVKRKGFSWFVDQVLPKLDDDVRYLIIGPINKDKSLMDKILGLLPQVISKQITLLFGLAADSEDLKLAIKKSNGKAIHTGSLKFEHLMSLVALAEIKLMPNIKVEGDMEGFGLVALEAGLRSSFVIAARLEGITCAVQHGSNGSLLRSEDVEEWIQAITISLADRQALKAKSAHAKSFVLENYSWERMTDAYINHFRELIASYEVEHFVFNDNLKLI